MTGAVREKNFLAGYFIRYEKLDIENIVIIIFILAKKLMQQKKITVLFQTRKILLFLTANFVYFVLFFY